MNVSEYYKKYKNRTLSDNDIKFCKYMIQKASVLPYFEIIWSWSHICKQALQNNKRVFALPGLRLILVKNTDTSIAYRKAFNLSFEELKTWNY